MSDPGNGAAIETLRGLRDRPFELLQRLEQRNRGSAGSNATQSSAEREWVGVACRMAGEIFLVAREETREVLGYPAAVTRLPGAKPWVKGLANVRGQLLPMLDLRQFLGSGMTHLGRNTRVIVVREFTVDPPPTVIRCDSYLAGAFRRGGEVWPVLSMKVLVESPSFLQAAA